MDSPAAHAGLTVYLAVRNRSVLLRHAAFRRAMLCVGRMAHECKNPTERNPVGFLVLATSYSRTAYRRTTIGAAAFHFRVRNGNGWCHRAIITRVRNRTGGSLLSQRRKRDAESLETSSSTSLSKEHDFQPAIAIGESKIFADSLTSTYRKKNVIRDSLPRSSADDAQRRGYNDSRFTFPRFTKLKELRFI